MFRNDDAWFVLLKVELGLDLKTGSGPSRADERNDGFVTCQRAASPIERDEGEKPVLDFVPLTGAGREVANVDAYLMAVCQFL